MNATDSADLRLADIADWVPTSEGTFITRRSNGGLRALAKAGKVRHIVLPNGEYLYDPNDLRRLKRPERQNTTRK
jgi:hypothetical protein